MRGLVRSGAPSLTSTTYSGLSPLAGITSTYTAEELTVCAAETPLAVLVGRIPADPDLLRPRPQPTNLIGREKTVSTPARSARHVITNERHRHRRRTAGRDRGSTGIAEHMPLKPVPDLAKLS